jgi:hypothetical protein
MPIHLVIQATGKSAHISKRFLILLIALAVSFFTFWWISQAPSEEKVASSFVSYNPSYSVVRVTKQRGDSVSVFYIDYTQPGDPVVHKAVWKYYHLPGRGWRLYVKQVVK